MEVVPSGAGASKDRAKEDGSTPLFIASQNGHLEVVRLLCDASANIDYAKGIASQSGHLEVVRRWCDY